MNDWPTHPSILTWKLLIITQGFGPLNSFLTTGITSASPGLSPTLSTPLTGVETSGKIPVGKPVNGPVRPMPGVMPVLPAIVTPLDVLISIPQPISKPTSSSPRGCSGPRSEPTNIPLDRYSRDEIAVVNGATGTCVSSLAPSPRVQPSGVLRIEGGFEAPDLSAA